MFWVGGNAISGGVVMCWVNEKMHLIEGGYMCLEWMILVAWRWFCRVRAGVLDGTIGLGLLKAYFGLRGCGLLLGEELSDLTKGAKMDVVFYSVVVDAACKKQDGVAEMINRVPVVRQS